MTDFKGQVLTPGDSVIFCKGSSPFEEGTFEKANRSVAVIISKKGYRTNVKPNKLYRVSQ